MRQVLPGGRLPLHLRGPGARRREAVFRGQDPDPVLQRHVRPGQPLLLPPGRQGRMEDPSQERHPDRDGPRRPQVGLHPLSGRRGDRPYRQHRSEGPRGGRKRRPLQDASNSEETVCPSFAE